MASELETKYSELTAEGSDQVKQGDYRVAAGHFESALQLAREMGDQFLVDRATCNLSTARLNLGMIQEA